MSINRAASDEDILTLDVVDELLSGVDVPWLLRKQKQDLEFS